MRRLLAASFWPAALLATSCTPALFTTGRYVEAGPPGVMLWVGHTLALHNGHTFSYERWSDDASGMYGSGTYRVRGRRLHLAFAAPVARAAQARMQLLAARPDSLHLAFRVEQADTTRGVVAIGFASVAAYSATGKLLAAAVCDTAGLATLLVPRIPGAPLLRVSAPGFLTWQQLGPAGSAAYRVRLPGWGTPYPVGTAKVLQLSRLRGGQWAMREGRSQYPMRWKRD